VHETAHQPPVIGFAQQLVFLREKVLNLLLACQPLLFFQA
jgi:hypothetical protein